jgi:hypothetical protein
MDRDVGEGRAMSFEKAAYALGKDEALPVGS